jgi:hypothetical protein
MDYVGQWGEGALDTPGPLNGTSEASAIWAQECCLRYIKKDVLKIEICELVHHNLS